MTSVCEHGEYVSTFPPKFNSRCLMYCKSIITLLHLWQEKHVPLVWKWSVIVS